MSRIKLSFGHFEGNSNNPKLVYERVDTTIKGILILLITLYPDIKIIIECITPRKHPKIYSLKIPKSKHMVPVR